MRLIFSLLIALIATSLLFVAAPSLDLATARLFYDGKSFPVATILPVEVVRVCLMAAEYAGFFAVLALTIQTMRKGRVLNLGPRDWLFQTVLFVVGPGLIVNRILKQYWGRTRPFSITEFGGDAIFSSAWTITDQCKSNCSFVSGEMAGATTLAICLIITLRANKGRMTAGSYVAGVALSLLIPLTTAWQRMAAGRHFLSDVVIAALLIGLLAAVLHRLFYGRQGGEPLLTSPPIPPISRLP